MDGYAGHTVWSDLLSAVAEGKHNPDGYTFALTDQAVPETIKIWHNGRLVLESAVNTGIPASPTADGTFPVYLRYYFQIIRAPTRTAASTPTPSITCPTSTAATRCTTSPGAATGTTRAWAA